jgi:hypothetical protein
VIGRLRDGSAFGQADAAARIALHPTLLFPTREEAVRDGIDPFARLTAPDSLITDVYGRRVLVRGRGKAILSPFWSSNRCPADRP